MGALESYAWIEQAYGKNMPPSLVFTLQLLSVFILRCARPGAAMTHSQESRIFLEVFCDVLSAIYAARAVR
jgi:hypothetical protein